MSTDYPGAIDSFDTHVDNVDDVMAADVNDLNDAVVAIQTELGAQPQVVGTWTPTVTQSGGVALTVTRAVYHIINGTTAITECDLEMDAAGTITNDIVIGGQPAAIQPVATGLVIGACMVNDAGTGFYIGIVFSTAVDGWKLYTDGVASAVGTTPNFALADGDTIRLSCTYRIA